MTSSANLKSMTHTLILAVVCVPVALLALTGLVFVPVIGRGSDELWRGLATWRGRRVPRPRAERVDWRIWACAVAQAVLGIVGAVGISLDVLLAGSFTWAAITRQKGWDLFGWHPNDAIAAPAMALLSASLLLLLMGFCWLVSGASVAVWTGLTLTRTSVDDLERSRRVLSDAFSAERRRIERELHDGVQQYLTAAQLSLAAAQLRSADHPELQASIDTAHHSMQRAVEGLRTIIRGIYPQVLEEVGLTEAIKELVGLSGLRGTVALEGQEQDLQLDSSAALLLYHAVAEGLTNAVKHGNASSVVVTIGWHPQRVEIVLVDDGPGPTADDSVNHGTGLAGLAERAATLGGGLHFGRDAHTGGGLLIVWTTRHPQGS
ncbi:histidine kinase [Luteococcus sp. H138]|uniref:sensor histidine kinase n=1 Tax=unclassified Luteococcus TaxID=2639923 RepID=UPI00313EEC2A